MCVKYKTSFLPRFKASATNSNTEETITKTIPFKYACLCIRLSWNIQAHTTCELSLHYARTLLHHFIKYNLQSLATFSTAKQNLPTKSVQYLQSLWQLLNALLQQFVSWHYAMETCIQIIQGHKIIVHSANRTFFSSYPYFSCSSGVKLSPLTLQPQMSTMYQTVMVGDSGALVE